MRLLIDEIPAQLVHDDVSTSQQHNKYRQQQQQHNKYRQQQQQQRQHQIECISQQQTKSICSYSSSNTQTTKAAGSLISLTMMSGGRHKRRKKMDGRRSEEGSSNRNQNQIVGVSIASRPPSSSSSFLQTLHTQLPLIALVLACFCFGYTQAVAECTSGNSLSCFDCNSHIDPFCADPFNWTTLPAVKECDGCCVKIVQGIETSEWKVRRSCTENLDINMFMVDHVCMSEGGGKGKMCFCEDDECNHAPSTTHPPTTMHLLMAAAAFCSTLLTLPLLSSSC